MKKILLASTAIVGFAGAASAAEITLSGYAEVGIFGGDDVETQFHNDWQVNFNFSGTTDNGLEFGGKVQIEETNGPGNTNGFLKIDDEAFWVSGAFGKVTLGETDGAFDWALSEIYTGTGLQDDHSTHAGAYWYTGFDGIFGNQIVRYEYSFGDFGVAVSAEMDDTGTFDSALAIGGKWSGSFNGVDVGAGLGYTSVEDLDIWGLSASAGFSNGFSVAAGYADGNLFWATTEETWWGIAAAYTTGALTVGVNYGQVDMTGGDMSGFGLVANYDLGGGAVAMASYGSSDNGTSYNGNGEDTFSLGLGLSF